MSTRAITQEIASFSGETIHSLPQFARYHYEMANSKTFFPRSAYISPFSSCIRGVTEDYLTRQIRTERVPHHFSAQYFFFPRHPVARICIRVIHLPTHGHFLPNPSGVKDFPKHKQLNSTMEVRFIKYEFFRVQSFRTRFLLPTLGTLSNYLFICLRTT